ncbi:MAG: Gfo/Idh/MocA family oxidoreductase [Alphaproteobacteria bacterium]|nr:Gfo/Idh/MocA family oxidoreductase [Alphaproteobacteria bacterium]
MAPYSVAIIGLGIMGRRMAAHMAGHADLAFAGGFDPSPAAAAAARDAVPDLTIRDDWQALIEDPATDFVYIACPPMWHSTYARHAIAAGKPIFCEKPLGIDLSDSRALVGELANAGIANVVNFAQASCEAVRLTEKQVQAGQLGQVVGVEAIVHFSAWPRAWQDQADWLRYREQGGFTREVLSHFVYVTARLVGPLELIESVATFGEEAGTAETRIVAALRADQIPVSVLGSSGGAGPDRVELTLWGTRNSFRIHDWYGLKSIEAGAWKPQVALSDEGRSAAIMDQLDQLTRWLAGDDHMLPSAGEALAVQELIEQMLSTPASG